MIHSHRINQGQKESKVAKPTESKDGQESTQATSSDIEKFMEAEDFDDQLCLFVQEFEYGSEDDFLEMLEAALGPRKKIDVNRLLFEDLEFDSENLFQQILSSGETKALERIISDSINLNGKVSLDKIGKYEKQIVSIANKAGNRDLLKEVNKLFTTKISYENSLRQEPSHKPGDQENKNNPGANVRLPLSGRKDTQSLKKDNNKIESRNN